MTREEILNRTTWDLLDFKEFHTYIKNNFAVFDPTPYSIEAIYAPDKESIEIIKRYFQLAHSCSINGKRKYPIYEEPLWLGRDWYFDVYESADDIFDGCARLESLMDKEYKFRQMKDELNRKYIQWRNR